jgi:hypothetical protein
MAINILIIILFIILVCLIVCNIVLNASIFVYKKYNGGYVGGMQPAEILSIGDTPPILVGMPKMNHIPTKTILSISDTIEDNTIDDNTIADELCAMGPVSIELALARIFTEQDGDISIGNENSDSDSDSDSIHAGIDYSDKILIKVKGDDWMTISIEHTFIELDRLDRCSKYSGTDGLQRIKKLAFLLKKDKIELHDASYIIFIVQLGKNKYEKQIKLYCLFILAYGISWYNKHNFFSINYTEEIRINNGIINLSINNFLQKCSRLVISKIIITEITAFYKRHSSIIRILNLTDENVLNFQILLDEFIQSKEPGKLFEIIQKLFNMLIQYVNLFDVDSQFTIDTKIKDFFTKIHIILQTIDVNDNNSILFLTYLEALLDYIDNYISYLSKDFLYYNNSLEYLTNITRVIMRPHI